MLQLETLHGEILAVNVVKGTGSFLWGLSSCAISVWLWLPLARQLLYVSPTNFGEKVWASCLRWSQESVAWGAC